jgi:hypothetical protein
MEQPQELETEQSIRVLTDGVEVCGLWDRGGRYRGVIYPP